MYRATWPILISAIVIVVAVLTLNTVIKVESPIQYSSADWTAREQGSSVFIMDEELPSSDQPDDLSWEVRTVVTKLQVPWDITTLPSGNLLVTERSGYLSEVNPEDGTVVHRAQVPDVIEYEPPKGEQGLTGVAIAPDFATSKRLYLYYSYLQEETVRNRVSSFVYDGERVSNERIIVELPGGKIHNGAQLRIGPDGKLWIPTGEGGARFLAQDPTSLGGKLLRLNLDGSIPSDNPTKGSAVYSLGHRNPQGFAWQPGTDRIYMTEHGQIGNDEVNLIKPGHNYGWPFWQYCSPGELNIAPEWLTDPVFCSWTGTVAPSGGAFLSNVPDLTNSFFVAGLRGQALHRILLDDTGAVEDHAIYFLKEYGRFRALATSADGTKLYLGTSNTDGRLGVPAAEDDDRILELTPILRSE